MKISFGGETGFLRKFGPAKISRYMVLVPPSGLERYYKYPLQPSGAQVIPGANQVVHQTNQVVRATLKWPIGRTLITSACMHMNMIDITYHDIIWISVRGGQYQQVMIR